MNSYGFGFVVGIVVSLIVMQAIAAIIYIVADFFAKIFDEKR